MPSQALFLHGGQGRNAELQRRRFGRTLPVHWWDQPPVETSSRPYEHLVAAALCALAAEGRLMNPATFYDVVHDVIDRPGPQAFCSWYTPVQVWIGTHDPYARDTDIKEWRTLLPGAEVLRVDAGHFPYKETDPTLWLSPLLAKLRV